MSKKQDKIVERIKRLMALAANTSHPEEADTAMRQAQKMIIKHSIDEELLGEEQGGSSFKVDRNVMYAFNPHGQHKLVLANGLAHAFGMKMVYRKDADGDLEMTLYGSDSDFNLLLIIFKEVVEFGSGEYKKARKKTGRGGAGFAKAFWMGYAMQVMQRAEDALNEVLAETPGADVVLFNRQELVRKAVEEDNPNLRQSRRNINISTLDAEGVAHGIDSGSKANISIHSRIEG